MRRHSHCRRLKLQVNRRLSTFGRMSAFHYDIYKFSLYMPIKLLIIHCFLNITLDACRDGQLDLIDGLLTAVLY